MATARTFKTRIDLPADRREKLIALLNQHLADTFDLYGQSKQAHWNVKGPQFHQLHELFDDLAEQLEGYIDLIAERGAQVVGYCAEIAIGHLTADIGSCSGIEPLRGT